MREQEGRIQVQRKFQQSTSKLWQDYLDEVDEAVHGTSERWNSQQDIKVEKVRRRNKPSNSIHGQTQRFNLPLWLQVVTGPNLSGKSCYAKQVALIVFLAHVGSYVPATEAVIGLTDRIFTRLVSSKTAGLTQSTFMIDLTQVANMLQTATSRQGCTLILADRYPPKLVAFVSFPSMSQEFVWTMIKLLKGVDLILQAQSVGSKIDIEID